MCSHLTKGLMHYKGFASNNLETNGKESTVNRALGGSTYPS